MLGVLEGLRWRFAVAISSAVRPFLVVVGDPLIEIGLQFFDGLVNLLSESNLVKLLQNRLMKAFADAVGLRASGFCFRVVDVLDGQVELILVVLPVAAVFGAAISSSHRSARSSTSRRSSAGSSVESRPAAEVFREGEVNRSRCGIRSFTALHAAAV